MQRIHGDVVNIIILRSWLSASSAGSVRAAIARAVDAVGFEELKKEQELAIRSFVNGRDVFIALPTGYGKSLCYALLPLVFDSLRGSPHNSIVLCVSPLTALMADQRQKFSTIIIIHFRNTYE